MQQTRQTGDFVKLAQILMLKDQGFASPTADKEGSTLSFHPANFLQGHPYLIIVISVASVTTFCFCSQVLLRYSKISNLQLNRYYSRKRFDKQKMLTNTIIQSKQMRQNANKFERQDSELYGSQRHEEEFDADDEEQEEEQRQHRLTVEQQDVHFRSQGSFQSGDL